MLQPLLPWPRILKACFWFLAIGTPAVHAYFLPERPPPAIPGAQLPETDEEERAARDGDLGMRIYREAIYSAGMDTGSLPGGGTFSGAAAVAFVLNRVLGAPPVSPYLSDLEHWLEGNGKRIADMRQLRPGDIILSPHSLTIAGQAGILGRKISNYPDFEIYANWAQNHLFVPSWSLRKWKEYFESRLGLDLVFFRVTRSPEKDGGEPHESLDRRRRPLIGLLPASPSR